MNRWFWMVCFLCVMAIGCGESGPTTYAVQGTVTLDGTPLPDGDIIFSDPNNVVPPNAGKIQNGKYELNATEGKKRVEIRASRLEKLPEGQEGAMGETEVMRDYIPERYNTSSELTAEVTPGGGNQFDFALESK